jgi:putative heme-binding domain-containing protein
MKSEATMNHQGKTRRLPPAAMKIFAAMLFAAPAVAQQLPGVPDPDAELERQSFHLADGLEVNLFASEPMIAKPINMNFDPRGRLFVASSSTYPQIRPGQEPEDKIYILEDTDDDGKADKSTVFADKLLIPTTVMPGDGGAYVANSTELLHMADTDGDGKADKSRVVLSGFGTEDTHHILHTMRWGPDGMLYFNQSIYIHSHIETPFGTRHLMAGGTWHLRPDTLELDVFARGWINHWGTQFDKWGQVFVTDGAGGEGVNFVVPGASYATAYGASRTVQGLNPGQPKLAGEEILSGRHIAPDWDGNVIANDFRGHRIGRFVLKDDGSGFNSTRVNDVLWTDHPAFRPVDVKMGPDGALYVADFYNPIINHGEVDFRDPRRDKIHGRIWRITWKGRPLVERPKLVGVPIEQVLDALKLPEQYTRTQAKRVLEEKGAKEVVPALAAWVKKLDPKDADFEHHRLEALWTYQSVNVVEPTLLKAVLTSPNAYARAAAARVIYHWKSRVPNALELLAGAVADENARVRMEAVCALRNLGTAEAAEVAMRAADKPLDKFSDYALWQTTRELESVWMPEFEAGRIAFGGSVPQIIFALKATGKTAAVRPLLTLYQQGKIAAGSQQGVLEAVAQLGGPGETAAIFEIALDEKKLTTPQRVSLLNMLRDNAARNQKPAGDLAKIGQLIAAGDEPVRIAAARLAGQWHQESTRPQLLDAATAATSTPGLQQAAIDGLSLLGGPESKKTLTELAAEGKPIGVRMMAAVGLAAVDIKAGAESAVAVLAAVPDGTDPSGVFDAFLQKQQGPVTLALALKEKKVPAAAATAGVRRASAAGRDMKPLIDALTAAGELGQMTQKLSPDELAKLLADVKSQGSPERGERVFRRATVACMTCHAVAGAGGRLGPDLISIGASAPLDYIVESVLDPSAKIKEGFHMTIVSTKSGRVVSGLLDRKTDSETVVREITGSVVTVPRDDIAKEEISNTSLMPPGLTAALRRDEFVDLIRFISELGREGAYKVGPANLVRTWRVMAASNDVDTKLRAASNALASTADPALSWTPAYSHVSGSLPIDELPKHNRFQGETFGYARFQIEATTAGKVALKFEDPTGLEMWVDQSVLKPQKLTELTLTAGVHTITLAVDLKRTAPLRIELVEAAGSGARAKLVTGP